jgi:iron complex outermembrane receptor protein
MSYDNSVVTGLRGELAGWRWDASANYGRNRFKLDVDHSANYSARRRQPDPLLCRRTDRDPAGGQPGRGARLRRPWLSGPLTVAWGAEYRHEDYAIGAGELNSYTGSGAQGFSGFRPENAGKNSRHNQSVYLNLEGNITKELSGSLARATSATATSATRLRARVRCATPSRRPSRCAARCRTASAPRRWPSSSTPSPPPTC